MILLIGYGACGFTFLDWSLAYLSGSNCCNNPITNNDNAHGHTVDHFDTAWQNRSAARTYWVPPGQRELSEAIPLMQDYKIVALQNPTRDEQLFLLSRLEKQMPHLNWYKLYSQTIEEIGDQAAVDYVFQQIIFQYSNYLNFSLVDADYVISLREMFCHLDLTISIILRQLGLDLAADRFAPWLEVYRQWQTLNPWTHSVTIDRIINAGGKQVDSVNVRDAVRFLKAVRDH
jgi:hypothetical protein